MHTQLQDAVPHDVGNPRQVGGSFISASQQHATLPAALLLLPAGTRHPTCCTAACRAATSAASTARDTEPDGTATAGEAVLAAAEGPLSGAPLAVGSGGGSEGAAAAALPVVCCLASLPRSWSTPASPYPAPDPAPDPALAAVPSRNSNCRSGGRAIKPPLCCSGCCC